VNNTIITISINKLLKVLTIVCYLLCSELIVSADDPVNVYQPAWDSLYQQYLDIDYDNNYAYQYASDLGTFDILINEVLAINTEVNCDSNLEFDDWIELYNFGDVVINLKGLKITDDKNDPDQYIFSNDLFIQPDSFIILWADNQTYQGVNHLNFSLDSEGETIYLFTSDDSTCIDSLSFGIQLPDVSYGRLSENISKCDYFNIPTPNTKNPVFGMEDIAPDPTSNLVSGFYSTPFYLSLNNDLEGSKLFYTLDCTEPTTASMEYTIPIYIDTTTQIRYKVFKNDYLPSHTVTQTFLFGTDNKLDVISLVTDSLNLYGPSGIFSYPKNGLEKPVHIEYFGRDKTFKFAMDAGIKIHAPKGMPQNSLRIYARSMYGDKEINYQFFEYKDIDEFKTIILRNAANDGTQTGSSQRTHFRDGLLHLVYNKIDPDQNLTSGYKPVSVYINGSYWGIYNIRERIDKDYIEENLDYKGDMDLLEMALNIPGNWAALEGDYEMYNTIYNFIKNNDLSIQENYDYVSEYIDIKSFTDYWIYEVYVGNFDWLVNNIKIYRPRIPYGKFQWIIWDLDHGLGLPFQNYGIPSWNTLEWSTSTEGGRPSNGSSNVHIRGLLQNEKYKYYFINRFADLLNENLNSDFIEPVIDSVYFLLYPEIQKQLDRWGKESFSNWVTAVQTMRNYVCVRPGYVRKHIMSKFELTDTVQVSLSTAQEGYGKIRINTIYPNISDSAWTGIYFVGVPIELEAIPEPGYKFVQWVGISDTSHIIELNLLSDVSIEAVFEPILIDSNRIVINEISFNSKNSNNQEDWIEIMNASGLKVDIGGWKLKDSIGNTFIFPENLQLKNYKYIIVARNKLIFESQYGNSISTYGDLPFSLTESNHHLYLYNDSDELIDEVLYFPDYSCADLAEGKGFTLELKNPYMDNNTMSSWKSSIILGGTPGSKNTSVPKPMQGLYINELMVDNLQTVPDEYGQYDDWIEIYNATPNDINIEGMFLTDDIDEPTKFQIPIIDAENTTVASHGFKLIWLDEDYDQGVLHTGLKLSNFGDQLYLNQNNGCAITNLDAVSFAEQFPDISFGRFIDGIYNWMYLISPTPGEPNQIMSSLEEAEGIDYNDGGNLFTCYPNPARDYVYVENNKYDNKPFYISIYNLMGESVLAQTAFTEKKVKISLSNFNPGLYFIRISNYNNTSLELKKLNLIK
jgi:hypothetical protein